MRPRSFVVTLVGALLATLVTTSVLQIVVGTRGIEGRIMAERLGVAVADAQSLEAAFRGPEGTGEHFDAVHDSMRGLLGRPGVQEVGVLSEGGLLVLGGTAGTLPAASRALAVRAIATGEPTGTVGETDAAGLLYAVPMRLGGQPHALLVVEDRAMLSRAEAGIRGGAALGVVTGLLVGGPLFFLAGGRRLLRAHHQVLTLSTSDGLTAVGNHRSFQEELRREVATAEREARDLTLLLIDLDDFKLANDRDGHRRGDEVLVAVAALLRTGRPADRPFRIGGDEFALLLPGTDVSGGLEVAERIRASVERAALGVTASVGVATLTWAVGGSAGSVGIAGPVDPDVLWGRADAALYQVKRRGRNGVARYEDIADGSAEIITAATIAELHAILEHRRVSAVFQPIWDLESERVLGFEALARPEPGPAGSVLASPAEAFAAARACGRTGDLDAVCRSAILARADLLPPGALLFINVSPQSLGHASLEPATLAREVGAAGLAPERVVVEITERDIARPGAVAGWTAALRREGFQVALDDVGAGNAGLEMLRHVPVEYVKVDREVVVAAPVDQHARAVLLAVITFADETGAFVIVEGIESLAELDFVRHVGERPRDRPRAVVRGAQGYLLGRPVSVPAVPAPAGSVPAPTPA